MLVFKILDVVVINLPDEASLELLLIYCKVNRHIQVALRGPNVSLCTDTNQLSLGSISYWPLKTGCDHSIFIAPLVEPDILLLLLNPVSDLPVGCQELGVATLGQSLADLL